jgi:sortase (surface protein transpeptidase)
MRSVRNAVVAWALLIGGGVLMIATGGVVVVGDTSDDPAMAGPGTTAVSTGDVPTPIDDSTEARSTLAPAEEPSPITDGSSEPPAGSTVLANEVAPVAPYPPPNSNVVPTRVRIPSIEVDATIIDLGLNPDRSLEVPKNWEETGWYTGRSVPGEIGPSVVVGHVDSAAYGPAVFFRLKELDTGDRVEIDRSDGSIAVFRVTDSVLVLKTEFPTEQVYGPTAQPTLRLITCGGRFDEATGSHLANLIVYAEHLGTRQPISDGQWLGSSR